MIYCLDPQNQNSIVNIRQGYVEYLWQKYLLDNSLVIFDSGIAYQDLRLEEIVKNNSHLTSIVFDGAVNAIDVDSLLTVINQLKLDKKTFIITSNHRYYNTHRNSIIKFLPFWALWTSLPDSSVHSYNAIEFSANHRFSKKSKTHKVSCLNGTPAEHRILTYLYLKDKSYFNDIIFTFGNRPQHYPTADLLTDAEKTVFQSLPQNVSFSASDATIGIDISVNHPAFLESYVNLVTETTMSDNISLLSEKTFKPIVTGQLFVLIAAQGSIKFLRDIGIDTFDDIIDHSYDTEPDYRNRIKMAIAQIDQLVERDLETLYHKIKLRLQRNSEYFLSQQFRDQFKLNFE